MYIGLGALVLIILLVLCSPDQLERPWNPKSPFSSTWAP